jgi:hypothetical protein
MTAAAILAGASLCLLLATAANERRRLTGQWPVRATRRGGITFHHFGRYCVTISKRKTES